MRSIELTAAGQVERMGHTSKVTVFPFCLTHGTTP
jgi:hypothetical protein